MLSKILNPLKSVDDILHTFTRTISELVEAAKQQQEAAEKHAACAHHHAVAHADAMQEATRALTIAAKLETLLNAAAPDKPTHAFGADEPALAAS